MKIGPRSDTIPNAPFREAALRERERGRTLSAMAMEAGWVRLDDGVPRGDTAPLKRALGLMKHCQTKNGVRYAYGLSERMEIKTAEKLLSVLNLDPVDVGL